MQLENIMQEHDLTQQNINPSINNDVWSKKIEEWEIESTKKILSVTPRARVDLQQILENFNKQFTKMCQDISVKLISARKANNFSEVGLNRWIEHLNELRLQKKHRQ